MTLPPLNGLRAFEAAARVGSFVGAAQELHVSPSAISRLVKLLEQRLGAALFDRLANGLVLTERGSTYLSEVSGAFQRIAQATERLKAAGGSALVIGAGPTLAMRWLIPRQDVSTKNPTSTCACRPRLRMPIRCGGLGGGDPHRRRRMAGAHVAVLVHSRFVSGMRTFGGEAVECAERS
jgi:hypothetical protein